MLLVERNCRRLGYTVELRVAGLGFCGVGGVGGGDAGLGHWREGKCEGDIMR